MLQAIIPMVASTLQGVSSSVINAGQNASFEAQAALIRQQSQEDSLMKMRNDAESARTNGVVDTQVKNISAANQLKVNF